MAIDREATLKNAEKFLRVGRLDAAITEYARVVEDQPRDWTTANTLGDLYLRVGQSDRAVALYQRVADQLLALGFHPRAAAQYKKLLKIAPNDEATQLRLADLSVQQGLLADAKSSYLAVAHQRRQRGDERGADEIVIRLGAVDPADLTAQHEAARALERTGDLPGASRRYRQLHEELRERGRHEAAAAALQDCLRCDPPARDAALLLPLLTTELDAGRFDEARELLRELLALGGGSADAVVALAWTLADTNVSAAVLCVEAAADAAVAAGDLRVAAAILQEFATGVPGQIGTLLKLVEVAVDAGFEAPMYEAQAQLADAYLAAQRPDEARVIAEDLVTREPQDPTHLERLRQALRMLQVNDIEAAVAACVRGSAPDPADAFDDRPIDEPPTADAAPPTAAAPSGADLAEIDLTGLLGELEEGAGVPAPSPAPPGSTRELGEVFAGIRGNVSREEEAEDSGEHLALGRTYMLMGMPDEAIGALEIAARSPQHRFAAAAALAQIYRDKSDLERAIDWLERAAEAPALEPDERYAVLYDLADVLETMRETGRALAVFLELAAEAPAFRDVGERVAHLSKVETEG